MCGGFQFSRVRTKFDYWQSPKILGNFSEIYIKSNKMVILLRKFQKMQIFPKKFNFSAGLRGKIRKIISMARLASGVRKVGRILRNLSKLFL